MDTNRIAFPILKNKNLEITLCNLGASIYRIRYFGEDMVVTTRDALDFYKPNVYFGKTIGRVCGRLPAVNNYFYLLQANEPTVSLHGGFDGLSNQIFNYEVIDNKVIFTYLSKDGEAGYPGDFNLKVIYELNGDNLMIRFIGNVSKPCLISLTNHTYFTLGESSNRDLSIKIDSDRYIKTDDKLLSLDYEDNGELYNFNSFKLLKDSGDIDNYFEVNDGKILLKSKHYELDIISNFQGTQIYTDQYKDDILTMLNDNGCYRGVALEPQDSPLDRKVLRPEETYERFIEYGFRKK